MNTTCVNICKGCKGKYFEKIVGNDKESRIYCSCVMIVCLASYVAFGVLMSQCHNELFKDIPNNSHNVSDNQNGGCSKTKAYITGLLLVFVLIPVGVTLVGLIELFCEKKTSNHSQPSGSTGCTRLTFKPFSYIISIKTHPYVTIVSHVERKWMVTELVQATWKSEQRFGADATGLTHRGIHVKHVLKVTNEGLLQQYNKRKQETTMASVSNHVVAELQNDPILTTHLANADCGNPDNCDICSLRTWLNMDAREVCLFHGTKVECVTSILEQGFDLSRARSGLYGQAIYLAESSQKADQYTDYFNNRRHTDLMMLIIRVTLGNVKCHHDDSAVNVSFVRKKKYDTVVAGFNKRFREFLVYDQRKVYPDFVIIYDRTDSLLY